MTDAASDNPQDDINHPQPIVLIARLLLTAGILLSALLFDWLGRLFLIPAQVGFSASLMQQPGWILDLLVIAIGSAAIMLMSGFLFRQLHPDAPVLITAAGLGVLSVRGGTMQNTLFAASGPSVFYALAFESVILFAVLAGAWLLLNRVRIPQIHSVTDDDAPPRLDEKLLGLFAHASAMAALMILICRTDAKDQALASVGVTSCLATLAAYQVARLRESFWFWISPVLVALVGYIYTASHAQGWEAGILHGPLAALARPLPLDYVSMGPVGAITGYWLAGGGNQAETEGELAETAAD